VHRSLREEDEHSGPDVAALGASAPPVLVPVGAALATLGATCVAGVRLGAARLLAASGAHAASPARLALGVDIGAEAAAAPLARLVVPGVRVAAVAALVELMHHILLCRRSRTVDALTIYRDGSRCKRFAGEIWLTWRA
jgi:hypothetical protein